MYIVTLARVPYEFAAIMSSPPVNGHVSERDMTIVMRETAPCLFALLNDEPDVHIFVITGNDTTNYVSTG